MLGSVELILFCFVFGAFLSVPADATDVIFCKKEGCKPNEDKPFMTYDIDCKDGCGCNKLLKYDEKFGCILNLENWKTETKYDSEGFIYFHLSWCWSAYGVDFLHILLVEYGIPTAMLFYGRHELILHSVRRRERADRLLDGIIISTVFFMVSAAVCVYCCHVRNSDRKLKTEVYALATKLKVTVNSKDLVRVKTGDQKEDSCNIVVPDANVFCV